MQDTPWPSDVFLKGGRITVDSIPLDGEPGALGLLALALSEMDGAPVYGSVFFPVQGEIVEGAMPGKATWVDLDETGRTFETGLWGRAESNELVALAPHDRILTAGHRYAVVVKSPSVRPSAQMREALEGRGPHGAIYTAANTYVREKNISAAAVFTVGRPTEMVDRMIDATSALSPPVAGVTSVLRGEALDRLAGRPTTNRPGLGDPAGVVHDALDSAILGSFESPSFLSASPPQWGRIESDSAGRPVVKGREEIPFLLALPKQGNADWARLPVIIFQHGLNAGRSQVLAVANSYALAGYATIGVDALWHGDRSPLRKDTVHNFTGAEGPDGLADADDFGASLYLFDFAGDATLGIAPFDGRLVRDNFRQAIVDLAELTRLLRHGDLSAIPGSDPALAGLAFDTERIVYTGESFGAVLGAGVIVVSPDLAGAVLSVGGGGIFLPMFPNSPTFVGMLSPFIKVNFDSRLDVSNPAALPAEAQRSLSLLNAVISPGDPLSFAPLVGERRRDVLMLQARSDELIPNQATELLMSAMGATFVELPSRSEGLRFVNLPLASAPYQAAAEEGTIAVVQISPALHGMFTGFKGQRLYQLDFPPFVPLKPPEPVDNPIELVHELAIEFAKSIRAGAAGRVASLPR